MADVFVDTSFFLAYCRVVLGPIDAAAGSVVLWVVGNGGCLCKVYLGTGCHRNVQLSMCRHQKLAFPWPPLTPSKRHFHSANFILSCLFLIIFVTSK